MAALTFHQFKGRLALSKEVVNDTTLDLWFRSWIHRQDVARYFLDTSTLKFLEQMLAVSGDHLRYGRLSTQVARSVLRPAARGARYHFKS